MSHRGEVLLMLALASGGASADASQSTDPLVAEHSPEWAPELEPTLRSMVRAKWSC